MKRIAIVLLASPTAACSTPVPPFAPPPAPAPVPAPRAAAPALPPASKPAPVAQTELPIQLFEQLRDAMANKSIYFDYDQYAIKPDETRCRSRGKAPAQSSRHFPAGCQALSHERNQPQAVEWTDAQLLASIGALKGSPIRLTGAEDPKETRGTPQAC
jgi:hypothetical protein